MIEAGGARAHMLALPTKGHERMLALGTDSCANDRVPSSIVTVESRTAFDCVSSFATDSVVDRRVLNGVLEERRRVGA